MKGKSLLVLLAVLIAGFYISACIGMCFYVRPYPRHKASFDLQKEYAESLENKLKDLLEPAVGIGNVKASVVAEISHQNIIKTNINPRSLNKITIHENGPVLVNQSVSVLINEKNKAQLPTYYRLIKAAIGLNIKRGDNLDVEILPFQKTPLWTLGLTPIYLMRIGVILFLVILGSVFWLIREWIRSKKKASIPYYLPDEKLWKQLENLTGFQLADQLKTKRPEITAFILYYLPQEKKEEIVELFSKDYMEQVTLHLNHIEQLDSAGKTFLLKEAEKKGREILKNVHSETAFESLKNMKDTEIQKLLYYVSKQDLMKALQNTSLAIQQTFARNIPPALWQELIQKAQENACSTEESLMAQEKIAQIAKLLKEKN